MRSPIAQRERLAIGTEMARFNRDRHRKKLSACLKNSDDEAFQVLVWAVDRLQSGDVPQARQYLDFPDQVIGGRIGDPHFIPPWELETLLSERLVLPPLQLRPGATNWVMNCRSFNAIGNAINILRRLGDAESGVVLRRMNVMRELPRMGHRQFEWQRGFRSREQVYRWPYLFSGPLCHAYFQQRTGVSIPDFIFFGMCVHELFKLQPGWMQCQLLDMPTFERAVTQPALRLLSAPIDEARSGARALKQLAWTTNYQPSQYRQTPLILIGDPPRLHAPLRDLILVRITSGLFYDVANAPQAVRNEIGDRFETYGRDLLEGALPALTATRNTQYRFQGNTINSPDILLLEGARLRAIFECKARKMSFAARYAEDPIADGGNGFDELIKGICQIWRFFAHIRLRFVPDLTIDEHTAGVLLTLDNWATMSRELQRELADLARVRAGERHPEITAQDQRAIVFCSIEELEQTLAGADEAQFLLDLRFAIDERYEGWILPNIHRQEANGPIVNRPYPFANRIGEVLPWWDQIDELAAASKT